MIAPRPVKCEDPATGGARLRTGGTTRSGLRSLSFRRALRGAQDRSPDSMTSPQSLQAPTLAYAIGVSVVMHLLALISLPPPPAPDHPDRPAPRLNARLAFGPHPLEDRPAQQVREAQPRAVVTRPEPPSDQPPLRETLSPSQPPDPGQEAPQVFPVESLTHLPKLVTEVSVDDWPSTPGAPSGSFQIEVDVGSDGRVMRVKPLCAPKICEAAATYAGVITGWRFVPAEILGHPVSSRIQIEFEIGSPESEGFTATPLPSQAPPRQ